MHKLKYVSSRGNTFELDVPEALVGTGTSLRGYKPGYTLGTRAISGITSNAQEVTLDLFIEGFELAEAMAQEFEFDFNNQMPGSLVYNGEWSQDVYVSKSEVQSVFHDQASVTLTVILLDGAWHKAHVKSFSVVHEDAQNDWLNLPTNFPYNLGITRPPKTLEVNSSSECPVKLTIYGSALQPRIVIGNNTYSFAITVPTSGRLVADGTRTRKSITLVTELGDVSDRFDVGSRGTGKGSGNYCFEPLKQGFQSVSWDGTFGFDLEWWETRGGLPWIS